MAAKNKTRPITDYPSKLYYSISEVAKIAGVKAHVLRYWESEFPTLKPRKTRSGSRRYRQSDIETVLRIRKLLYEDGFKIAGARKALRETQRHPGGESAGEAPQLTLGFDQMDHQQQLAFLRGELEELLALVRALAASAPEPAEKELEAKN